MISTVKLLFAKVSKPLKLKEDKLSQKVENL